MSTNPDQPTMDLLPTREGYDAWSEIYDAEDNPLVRIEEPRVRDMLGNLRGLRVADVGCGTGRHALQMAAAGASVTAMDFSEGMLDKARCKPGADAVTWIAHDLHQPLPLETAAFDRVTCCLVVDHIADLTHLMREMGRIVRPDGFIVLSSMHPAMMLRGVQARYTHPATGRETRPASCPHQISDYVMASVRAGLRIDAMSEHLIDESIAAASERARKYLGWPILLMMKLSVKAAIVV